MALGKRLCALKRIRHYQQALFLIPYFFTFANAFFGFFSVIAALQDTYITAAIYIILAACMDACDGRLARAFGSTSCLGAELDGLCDAISFCCAPAVLLYCFYQNTIGIIGTFFLGLYLCAGLFRLAKFNSTTQPCNYFSGLSTPVSAVFLATLIIYHEYIPTSYLNWFINEKTIFGLTAILATLMISTIPFPSFKNIKISLEKIIFYCFIAVIALAWCWHFKVPTLLLILLIYIANPIMIWLHKKMIKTINKDTTIQHNIFTNP